MAEILPINFPIPPESALANYNWTDIASGTGYISYYGGMLSESGALFYQLSSNTFYSQRVMTRVTTNSGAYTKTHDIDFDIKFKSHRTIKGDLIASVPVMIYAPGVTGFNGYVYPIVKVRKWNGTAETEIASGTGKELNFAITAINTHLRGVAGVFVSIPETVYAKDETLRITVELWSKADGVNTLAFYLGHDPKNRATTGFDTAETGGTANTFDTEPSNLIFQIPFRIDL